MYTCHGLDHRVVVAHGARRLDIIVVITQTVILLIKQHICTNTNTYTNTLILTTIILTILILILIINIILILKTAHTAST